MTQTPDPGIGHNAPQSPFEKLREETRRLGSIMGKAEETLTTHFLQVIEAAMDGLLDLQKKKHNNDRDDAALLAEDYAVARNAEIVFSMKKPKHKVAAARTRLMIKLGRADVGDVVSFVHRSMDLFRKMRAVPANSNKLKDPSNFMMAVARRTLVEKQILPMAVVTELAMKKETQEPTVVTVLEGMRQTATDLRDGRHRVGTYAAPDIDTVIKALNRALKAIADAAGQPTP